MLATPPSPPPHRPTRPVLPSKGVVGSDLDVRRGRVLLSGAWGGAKNVLIEASTYVQQGTCFPALSTEKKDASYSSRLPAAMGKLSRHNTIRMTTLVG